MGRYSCRGVICFFFQCGNFFLENGQNKSEMYELSVMTTKMAIIERWELVEFGLYLKTRMLQAGNHELICNQYDKLSYTYS